MPWLALFPESVHGCGMVAVPLMVALALPLLELSEGKSQQRQRRERNPQRPCLVAYCDGCCSHCYERSCRGCSGTHREKEPEAATEGTESATRESATPLPCGSVMSVASIVATALPWWVALRSSDGCLCLGCSGTLRGNGAKSRNGGRNKAGSATPLPYRLSLPKAIAEWLPVAVVLLRCRLLSLLRTFLPCWLPCVAPMVALALPLLELSE